MIYLLLFSAVVLGFIIAQFFTDTEPKYLAILLAFSGSFLLSTTLFELLPEVFETTTDHVGVFIMVGILLQIILDFFSKGAEHGHVHLKETNKSFPWLLFISLSLHALIEGYPLAQHDNILWGVIVHKIPIVIILAIYFNRANYSKVQIFLFMVIFGLMTPFGSWVASETTWFIDYATEINAIAIGVFLHVSTTILFESSKNHSFNLSKMLAVLIAAGIAFII